MRSEAYRRRVAALPCVQCGIDGYSQAAHSNQLANGKGMGRKADDAAIFPLCADRPGVRGCHALYDQGALYSKPERPEVEARWIAWTKAALAIEEDARARPAGVFRLSELFGGSGAEAKMKTEI